MDNINVYSKDFDNHIQALGMIFHILIDACLKLKLKKCSIGMHELTYLGHAILAKGIKVDPTKIAIVEYFPSPKHVEGVQSFLGLTNHHI